MIGIYKIENKVNGNVYIGQSADIWGRVNKHKSELLKGTHDNYHLQKDWNTHKENDFNFTVEVSIECCEGVEDKILKDVLLHYEALTMDKYKNKYNILGGYEIIIKGTVVSKKPSVTKTMYSLVVEGKIKEVGNVVKVYKQKFKLNCNKNNTADKDFLYESISTKKIINSYDLNIDKEDLKNIVNNKLESLIEDKVLIYVYRDNGDIDVRVPNNKIKYLLDMIESEYGSTLI